MEQCSKSQNPWVGDFMDGITTNWGLSLFILLTDQSKWNHGVFWTLLNGKGMTYGAVTLRRFDHHEYEWIWMNMKHAKIRSVHQLFCTCSSLGILLSLIALPFSSTQGHFCSSHEALHGFPPRRFPEVASNVEAIWLDTANRMGYFHSKVLPVLQILLQSLTLYSKGTV